MSKSIGKIPYKTLVKAEDFWRRTIIDLAKEAGYKAREPHVSGAIDFIKKQLKKSK